MKPNEWEVFDYEVMMLNQTGAILGGGIVAGALHNAVVESHLLHTRILVDILTSYCKQNDDLRLSVLLPSFTSPRIDELRTAYGYATPRDTTKPYYVLNKMLAHGTSVRSDKFTYGPILQQLVPSFPDLLKEVEAARPPNTR